MSIDQDIANSSKILEQDVQINHDITHGDDTTEVPTEGGPVPTIAKRLKDIETEWSQQADPLAQELADTVQITSGYKDAAAASAGSASTSATESQSSASASEQSRQASAITAGQSASSATESSASQQAAANSEQAVTVMQADVTKKHDAVMAAYIPLATDLIRTQTVMIEHHAFQ